MDIPAHFKVNHQGESEDFMAKVRKRGNSYQIDYFDPDGKRVRKSFTKKKDAEAELGKRVSLIVEGRYLDIKKECKTTLKEVLNKYKENYQDQASYQTQKKFSVENFHNYFGELTLISNIRYVDLETYRNHLKRKLTTHGAIRKDATINREMSCLRHIFRKAVEWDMIEQSPFDKGRSLQLKENNKRLRFLNDDEISNLLNNCNGYVHDIIFCAINTGMRRGEILGLKWSQIRNGFIYLRKTKTSEPRQIPINDDLQVMFDRLRDGLPASNVVDLGGKPVKPMDSEYVFTYNGKPISSIKRAFNTATRGVNIEDFRFHDLRHTFASQVLLRGGDLKDIQELLGHKTMTMTLRYAHLTQEHKKRAVNLLNGLTASKKEKDVCHKTVTSLKSLFSASR